MSISFEAAHQIYERLQDNISRDIFMSRNNYLITGDNSYRQNLSLKARNLSADIIMFAEKLYTEKLKKLVVFCLRFFLFFIALCMFKIVCVFIYGRLMHHFFQLLG